MIVIISAVAQSAWTWTLLPDLEIEIHCTPSISPTIFPMKIAPQGPGSHAPGLIAPLKERCEGGKKALVPEKIWYRSVFCCHSPLISKA